MNRRAIFRGDRIRRGAVFEARVAALWLRAIVPADLDDTLEVDVHAVGELERLEVSEAHDRGARSEVLDLLESAIEMSTLIYVAEQHRPDGLFLSFP
jgi:hypothetical protein